MTFDHSKSNNADMDKRIAWHLQHRKYCAGRDIPEKLKVEIAGRETNG